MRSSPTLNHPHPNPFTPVGMAAPHAAHGHSHEDGHDHGHSHRQGEATRYWRDPKAVTVTLVCFLLFLYHVVSRPALPVQPPSADALLEIGSDLKAEKRFVQILDAQRCVDIRPGDRSCDSACPEGFAAYRSDLGGCVSGTVCAIPTLTACLDPGIAQSCASECSGSAFGKHVALERLVRQTLYISNATLFLLGGILALVFAKVVWLTPLLESNEHALAELRRRRDEVA